MERGAGGPWGTQKDRSYPWVLALKGSSTTWGGQVNGGHLHLLQLTPCWLLLTTWVASKAIISRDDFQRAPIRTLSTHLWPHSTSGLAPGAQPGGRGEPQAPGCQAHGSLNPRNQQKIIRDCEQERPSSKVGPCGGAGDVPGRPFVPAGCSPHRSRLLGSTVPSVLSLSFPRSGSSPSSLLA